jgi:hypothetical protein
MNCSKPSTHLRRRDIAPTIYQIVGITQDPIDGVSMAYTFADASAPTRKETQYFETQGSRGIYHKGWLAGTFGPMVPWDTASSAPKLKDWDANKDVWELYDVSEDFSLAKDLAAEDPERLEQMKALFLAEAERFGRALRAWWRLWGAHALFGQGRTRLRIQHADHRAHHRALQGEARSGQAPVEVDTTIAKPCAPAEVVLKVDGAHCAGFALAEWLRRTVDRFDPARVRRPSHRLKRGPSAANLAGLCSLLQRRQNPLVFG